MPQGRRSASPFNAISPVVLALAAVMTVIELGFMLGASGVIGGRAGIGWRMAAIQDWGFSPLVWDQVVTWGNTAPRLLARFVTYAFVHGSFTHALFAVAMLLALGKFVGDVFRPWAVLAVFLGGVLTGAVVFALVMPPQRYLFGAYPGVYALIGAFTWILWAGLGARGLNRLAAFRLIGFLLVLQLAFAAIGPLIGGSGVDLGFIAELASFAMGFALSVVVSPGGFRALQARLRSRN
ncbi:MAG: rhomboid family intramembrane serine protease [Rubellimicrobium sp.]|nr:rhomboid family intramembrane serine protease [Rubellimicrobium sp.]